MTARLFLSAEIRFSQSQVTVTHDSSQLTPSMTFRGQSCLDKNISQVEGSIHLFLGGKFLSNLTTALSTISTDCFLFSMSSFCVTVPDQITL